MAKKKKRQLIIGSVLGAFLILVLYAVYAGKAVTDQMMNLQWDLPSRIYSSTRSLYPGAHLLQSDLATTIDRLGYQKILKGNLEIGQWKKVENGIEIFFRSFQDFSGKYPQKHMRFEFSGPIISKMVEILSLGEEEMDSFLLEPLRIGEIFSEKHEQRTLVRYPDVPKMLIQAIVVTEDRKFFTHHGISWTGIARAFLRNLKGGHVMQGGSTLTQQLMKNMFLSPERSLFRKMKELVMTVITELFYSKEQIMEAYINEIYLGQKGPVAIHGFGEAALFYFSKELKYLSLSEQALLAGMISSPGKYNPYTHLDAAYERRNVVLNIMWDQDVISKYVCEKTKKEIIQPRGAKQENRIAPYFLDFIQSEIHNQYSELSLQKEGLEIYTSLDPVLQSLAEKAIEKGLKALGKKAVDLQTALISIHPKTGQIKALVGGKSYGDSQYNRVTQVMRPVGSLIKPFVVSVALSPPNEGEKPFATLATKLTDQPATFSIQGKDWAPKNYELKYFGETTVRKALEHSLNVATINLASRVPFDLLVEGLKNFLFENVQALPSITLGAIASSPIEVIRAYSAFPNGGLLTNVRGIVGIVKTNGEHISPKTLEMKQVISPQVAFLVTYALQGVVEQGTARRIRWSGIDIPLAGKTGTTDDNRDSWFVGYTPSLLTGVWLGRDDNVETGFTGSTGALTVWIQYMKEVQKRVTKENFEIPSEIDWFEIDRDKGCIGGSGEILREAFLQGTQPSKCE